SQDRVGGPSSAIAHNKESKSPCNQRRDTADIEYLKTCAARRFEERRHTDSPGESGRWIPSPKQVSKAKRHPFIAQDSIEEEDGGDEAGVIRTETVVRKNDQSQSVGRQSSQEENTGGLRSPRGKNSSSFDARDQESQIPVKSSAKIPATRSHSAGATCYRSRDTRDKINQATKYTRERRHTDTAVDPPGWEPPAECTSGEDVFQPSEPPVPRYSGTSSSLSLGSTPIGVRRVVGDRSEPRSQDFTRGGTSSWESARRSGGLNQRLRDLYDFKVDTEWPRKVRNTTRRNVWIGKSSSEENDRRNYFDHNEPLTVCLTERGGNAPFHDMERQGFKSGRRETLDDEEREERLRIFHDKLRFSEDLGQPYDRRESRILSTDFGSKSLEDKSVKRTTSSDGYVTPLKAHWGFGDPKRPSIASRDSRASYAEIDEMTRKSRVSDASYVSIDVFERGVEAPVPRRAFSQGDDPKALSSNPQTPPSTPLTKEPFSGAKNFETKQTEHPKPERQGSKFKIYLV
ncbi:uncharacterized protein LOC110117028, partial [Athalia rosae]|uniref:uncharacterized protein LOC110117028 n=1 Tax=Athalia rosae TaxID=37344 RepID=UPI002033D200